ncbi:hypothetical protein PSENEW3n2_00000857 [Picochlorum sp. SENEW3]|nr:hypothetical protein PSENEW3n2_00000857 [Picochlorum sp. SENEW3]WPT15779.1 hypothetical protein PSENEW3_00000857 [Picochlorum sp. SENEW3]
MLQHATIVGRDGTYHTRDTTKVFQTSRGRPYREVALFKALSSCLSMGLPMVGTRGTMNTRRSISPASRKVACRHTSSGSSWGP